MPPSFWRLWAPLVLYLGLIFWSSSRPAPEIASESPDFVLHGSGYFLLGILAARAFAGGLDRLQGKSILFGTLLTIMWGLSDEWHQSFVPSRDASWTDVLSDAAGALAAAAMLAVVARWRRRLEGAGASASVDSGG